MTYLFGIWTKQTPSLTILPQRGIKIILKIEKIMNELINKIIQTSTLIVIFCIVVYGSVNAQQVCCSSIADTCSPASNRITTGYSSSNACPPSHHNNNQLRSNLFPKKSLSGFGSGNTCCKADHCDRYSPATYFNRSIIQHFYPLRKNVSAINAGNHTQPIFNPYSLPTSLKVFPIYIMTQAIIC